MQRMTPPEVNQPGLSLQLSQCKLPDDRQQPVSHAPRRFNQFNERRITQTFNQHIRVFNLADLARVFDEESSCENREPIKERSFFRCQKAVRPFEACSHAGVALLFGCTAIDEKSQASAQSISNPGETY